MTTNCLNLQELTIAEAKEIDGGNPLFIAGFVVGAIVGGLIYDGVKYVWKEAVKGYVDASSAGVYEGMPSPSFRH